MTALRSEGSEKTNILIRRDDRAPSMASRRGFAESSGRTRSERDIVILI
jgi:hypothetical protein